MIDHIILSITGLVIVLCIGYLILMLWRDNK